MTTFNSRTFADNPGILDDLEHGEGAIIVPYFDVQPGEVVFDVGAANATWTIYALASGAKVYAFEPSEPHFEKLVADVDANPSFLHRAYLINAGLDNVSDIKTLAEWYGSLGGYDGLELTPDCHVRTRFEPLDTFASHLTRLDWIKIDVEAGELRVMQGGAESIRKFRPKMIIENHENIVRMGPWMRENRIVEQMTAMLTELEYDLIDVPHHGRSFLIGRPR